MTNIELKKIKDCLNNKKKKISAGILFCKAFLSFSCIKNKAVVFALKNTYFDPKTMKRVLFVLKSNPNINETFNTHADIEKYSFYPNEKEILFFPYSCFDIINISEIVENEEILVKIELSYISRHDSRLRNKDNFNEEDINKSLIDSEFKKDIREANIIDQNEIDKSSISSIIDSSISFIQEENNIIENNKSSNQKNLQVILKELNEDIASSNELFEISHENIPSNNNLNDINIINNNINDNNENIINDNHNNNNNNDNIINNINKKINYKKFLVILIIILIIIIAIVIIIVVVIHKKNKSNAPSEDKISKSINDTIISNTIYNTNNIEDKNNIEYSTKIQNSETIKITEYPNNSDKEEISDNIELNSDDFYPNFDENSEEYQIAMTELEEMNKFRREHGVGDLKLDLELTNLAYDDIMEMLTTSTINIGGKKNYEGESVIQYIHIYQVNNTYIPGITSEAFYNSKRDSLEQPDCLISEKTTNYGFGVIRLSDGYIAVVFLYPPCPGGQDLLVI